jgi:hypothetical protein
MIGRANALLCPSRGRSAGALTNIEDWTDFIYVGNIFEGSDDRVAMIICPPENHGGKFGHVVWRTGFVERLPPSNVKSLIKSPWVMATNADEAEISFLKRQVKIRIPKPLMAYYGTNDTSFKPPGTNTTLSIFDEMGGQPAYSSVVVEADRDLTGDEWVEKPLHQNLSRFTRCEPIAERILSDAKPKIEKMTVTELMNNLKRWGGHDALTGYVGVVVYAKGNRMIIAEIKSRPPTEREVLAHWVNDRMVLAVDPNGENLDVYEVARDLLPQSKSNQ